MNFSNVSSTLHTELHVLTGTHLCRRWPPRSERLCSSWTTSGPRRCLTRGIIPKPLRGVSRTADTSSLYEQGRGERIQLVDSDRDWNALWYYTRKKMLKTSVSLTIGGLNNSLSSVKLDRNRVRGVTMGSSRMMDERDVTLFSSFFWDPVKRHNQEKI